MEIFGYVLNIGNMWGAYSFLFLLVLLALYFMRPKPFKKVIPSLIFLEAGEQRLNMSNLFRRFIKDWLIILQFLLIVILCLASLDITTEMLMNKMNKEVVFVIDASASSQAKLNNDMVFNLYKSMAKKRIGAINSIVLVKNSPQILARQTNPVNAFAIINSLKPSDSLSNIWDAMMVSADLAGPRSNIIIFSDICYIIELKIIMQ